MMSYEKFDVYKVAMEFLKIAMEIIKQLPTGNAVLAGQSRRAGQRTSLCKTLAREPAKERRRIAGSTLTTRAAVPWNVVFTLIFARFPGWQIQQYCSAARCSSKGKYRCSPDFGQSQGKSQSGRNDGKRTDGPSPCRG